jgi:hypothetical protein
MRSIVKFSLIFVAPLLMIGTALAGDIKDSGSADATYARRDVQPIADQDGHVLTLTDAIGTSKNTAGTGYLDGFSFDVREIMDLKQGNGPSQGYVVFSNGGDQQIVKIAGVITTIMKDGQPSTTMKGKWSIVKATGHLDGIRGDGTYTGYFTAKDKFHVDWEGRHSQPQASADAQ